MSTGQIRAMAGAPAIHTVASIRELAEEQWNALVGADDFYLSYQWLTTIERDAAARTRYLAAVVDGRLVGALPLYRLRHEGGPLYQIQRFGQLLGIGGDHLIAGARIGTCNAVPLAGDLPVPLAERTTRALLLAAASAAAGEGLDGIVLPYLSTPEVIRVGRAVAAVAAPDSSAAVIHGLRNGFDAYLAGLPKWRRYEARRELRAYAAAGWRDGVEPLADCLPDVARLVCEVERRHGYDTPDFLVRRMFRWEQQAVGRRAAVLTCRDEAGELAGCSVSYSWHDMLYVRAVGLDYARLRQAYEYFNLIIYRAARHAADHGLDRLHLGLTTHVKTLRGALVSPLWTAAVRADAAGRPPGLRLRSGVRGEAMTLDVAGTATGELGRLCDRWHLRDRRPEARAELRR